MSILLTLAAFIVALSVLIVVHEFGHYWVARRCGVKVLCFSVGFGRALFSRTCGADRTELRVALVTLGGYVKMLDEREGDVAPSELHRAFNRKNVWQRSAIVAAGPVANFLLAILLYWVVFLNGITEWRPILAEPAPGTPAAAAGIRPPRRSAHARRRSRHAAAGPTRHRPARHRLRQAAGSWHRAGRLGQAGTVAAPDPMLGLTFL